MARISVVPYRIALNAELIALKFPKTLAPIFFLFPSPVLHTNLSDISLDEQLSFSLRQHTCVHSPRLIINTSFSVFLVSIPLTTKCLSLLVGFASCIFLDFALESQHVTVPEPLNRHHCLHDSEISLRGTIIPIISYQALISGSSVTCDLLLRKATAACAIYGAASGSL